MRETSSSRHERRHLCGTLQHAPHNGAHNRERQQKTERAGGLKTGSDADEETDADSAAETDEGDVSGSEVTTLDE